MRKVAILLPVASLLAGCVVAAPVISRLPGDDVTAVGEAILAAPAATAVLAGTANPDCTDTAYELERWRLVGTYTWSYNPAGAPASVRTAAATTIFRATANLVTGQNRCGIRPTLRIAHAYQGASVRVAQVSSTAGCTGNDGVSVTGWGALPVGMLAYTCVYYRTSTGAVVSSDMLINSAVRWFAGALPAGCAGSYDLESVVVHERGHTAGLAHVNQILHPRQTMSPRSLACTTYKRLLGGGDLKGLQVLSGTA